MDFANIYAQGFARVAARVLPIRLAAPSTNVALLIDDATDLAEQGVCLAVYPELGLTGYSCGDLFLQESLLDAAELAVGELIVASANIWPVIIAGAPLRWRNRIYNCAVVVQGGRLRAVIPKSYLPNHAGFAERRWFAPGDDINTTFTLPGLNYDVPFANRQIINVTAIPGMSLGIEICEDMWVPIPPHAQMALQGATVLVNLSSSPTDVEKNESRQLLARSASARCNAAFMFVAAGWGESSTDAAWDGHSFVYECGDLLGQSARFSRQAGGTIVDIDLRRLQLERQRQGTQDDNARTTSGFSSAIPVTSIGDALTNSLPTGNVGLRRPLPRYPFVPDGTATLARRCKDAYRIQVTALARRLVAVGKETKAVIGVSGGLDSTNALLVAAGAMDYLGRPHSDILAFTMPGFATSDTTRSNAWLLMQAVGATAEEIDIRPAANQMLSDLGHSGTDYDVTFENVQAGLRADYLFRAANQRGGLVVGTGDMSEAALGWCTYGVGDHMSHFNVNAGLPKTLMRHQISWLVDQGMFPGAADVLRTILSQEISPELVPAGEDGPIQSTESAVGPYALNDFFLFYMLAGHTPSRIAYLAWQAWRNAGVGSWPAGVSHDAYDLETIRVWLGKFYQRFFSNQFKRSVGVDGPQVLPMSLGARGGWLMPSDAMASTWFDVLNREVPAES